MGKTGKPPKTGGRSWPQRNDERDQVEKKPAPPARPPSDPSGKLPKSLLKTRSPLSLAFRHIQNGWRNYLLYVEIAARNGDLTMVRYRDCYEGLPEKDKMCHWPEQICDLANVTPGELVGAVCRQIWETKAAESSMISSLAHPELLLATIKFAKKEENVSDRERYFRMMGSLPDRKGTSINIFNAASSNEVKLPDLSGGRAKLKTFDEEVIDMSRTLEPAGPPFLVDKEESDESGLD